MGIHNHHEFEQWPGPLLSLHVPLLKSLVPRDLGSIVCAITLGALFRSQQAKWQNSFVNSQNTVCPLCEQGEDNRIHFLVECEKLMSLRRTFATLLYDISTKCPAMLSLPVAYKHPYHHYLAHTLRSLSWPPFLDPQGFGDFTGAQPVCFTDGSCCYPQIPAARFAAFAIIVSTTIDQVQWCNEAFDCAKGQNFPPSLHPFQVGLIPGEQTINRAEALAVLHVIRCFQSAVIVTDSLYAYNLFTELFCDSNVANFVDRENFDIITLACEILQTKDSRHFQLKKITAHQRTMRLIHCWTCILSWVIELQISQLNRRCKTVHLLSTLLLGKLVTSMRGNTVHSSGIMTLCSDGPNSNGSCWCIKKARLHGWTNIFCEVLLEWGPSSPWQDALQFSPGDLNNEDNFHVFIPGAGLLHGIIEWSQTLQWPVAQHADDPGISQFELVSHFVHCFGMALPKVASRAKGYPIYADKVRDKEYDCLPATGADAVRFLQLAMRHIESTMGIQIFPVGHLTRRPSLRPLGFGALVSGYLARPLLPETLHHMQRFPSLISTTGLTFPEPCGQVNGITTACFFYWHLGSWQEGAILEQIFSTNVVLEATTRRRR